MVQFAELVDVSRAVASTRSRTQKVKHLASMLAGLSSEEAAPAVSFLSGSPRQDRLGIGYAIVGAVRPIPAKQPSLAIVDVDVALERISEASGPGSKARKESLLKDLMERATTDEQDFLRGLILRNLRQGALEGVMADAVAQALEVPAEEVRRSAMLEGDLTAVATRALAHGAATLARSELAVFTPIQPMLAKTAASAGEAVQSLGEAVIEWKLDGARIQVHRAGGRVAVFTRNLNDITSRVPEIVADALSFEASSFILDGEALLMDRDGLPRAFQDSMSRFGSGEAVDGPGLRAFYFDCLHLDGEDLIDLPLGVRRNRWPGRLPMKAVVGCLLTDDPKSADEFFDQTVALGFEGVVVKARDQPYQAGRRGAGWLKVKPTHTLDLVVMAAEWGSGRRSGWLSNLHLGARGENGEVVMLGKTFKGLSDEMLQWQTGRFLEIEDHRSAHVVYLKPELVYEIAFDGVQRSSRYPGGVALRFARVKRYRDDKGLDDADTIATVRSFLRR
ncbi:MAG: ATP-dependent DNA ligase [Acidimicrobiia bacterium]